VGHLEEDPSQELFLVRFETGTGELGPPTGCWREELAVEGPSETYQPSGCVGGKRRIGLRTAWAECAAA